MAKKYDLDFIKIDCINSERDIVLYLFHKYKKKYGLIMETTDLLDVLDTTNDQVLFSKCMIFIFGEKKNIKKFKNKLQKKFDMAKLISNNMYSAIAH